ncbi:unnamed protein product, partial [Allacma fusca]
MLGDQENVNLLKNYLGSVGGTTVEKITASILMKLFSRQFALEVNYTGQNRNHAFKDSKLHHILIDCVRQHFPGKTVDEKCINKAIQNWFRGAKDRYGGRIRPNKCLQKNQETPNPVGGAATYQSTNAD